jgi:ferritin-like protein
VASETLHEQNLPAETLDWHRAIVSLMEELEAIDWYQQRVDATENPELKSVLAHNRDEEIEHAMMNLEWIRRNHPTFNAHARTYLFSEGPITEVEKTMKAATTTPGGNTTEEPQKSAGPSESTPAPKADGSLGVGSLKID